MSVPSPRGLGTVVGDLATIPRISPASTPRALGKRASAHSGFAASTEAATRVCAPSSTSFGAEMRRYLPRMAAIAFLRPVRADFHLDPTEDEMEALGRHLTFLQGLVAAGDVVTAGPAEDGSLGLVVFSRLDAAGAAARMAEDPAVEAGVFRVECLPWRMSLFGTGTGRDWLGFTQAVHLRAPAAAVWRAVATPEGMERWFLLRADASTADGRELPRDRALEPGARLRLTWPTVVDTDAAGRAVPGEVSEGDEVLRAEPPQRLRISWYEGKGWVEFRIVPRPDGRVTVELEQRMHPTADFRQLESAYVGCHAGWAFFLTNLKSVLEHGIDLREGIPDRRGLVNA
ncbi:MAG: hypothetical protein FJ260_00565 [Planctomycetes bacterium]|nr:hypothetical protein [Planctomycetota bacterium]